MITLMNSTERLALAAVLTLLTGCARGMRGLKEGPLIDPDGREFKTARLPAQETEEPRHAAPVRVHCTESIMVVSARSDLYGNGVQARAGELRLGPPGAAGTCTPVQHEMIGSPVEHVITAGLHECGAEVRVEGDSLVYSNTLFHDPTPNRFGITRTVSAAVPVECRYKRTHFVSSNNQQMLLSANLVAPSAAPTFNLQLQTDDWSAATSSSTVKSGDAINMAASVLSADHSRFKLFLDSCVAKLEPDAVATPEYPIIHNHGCPAAPRSGSSTVSYLARTEDHVLRLQLDLPRSVRNEHSSATTMYITCWLKASDAAQEENAMNKACSYIGNSWRSVDGKHEVCECCEGACDVIHRRTSKHDALKTNPHTGSTPLLPHRTSTDQVLFGWRIIVSAALTLTGWYEWIRCDWLCLREAKLFKDYSWCCNRLAVNPYHSLRKAPDPALTLSRKKQD